MDATGTFICALPLGVGLGLVTYYLGENIYRADSQRPSTVAGTATTASAAALGLHDFAFPATIAFLLLYTYFLIKSRYLKHPATKPILLLTLLALDVFVLAASAATPIFRKCGLVGCTYASASLEGKKFGGHDDYADDYNMPQSYTNSNAIIYFFTALLALPVLLHQIYLAYVGRSSKNSSSRSSSGSPSRAQNQSLIDGAGDPALPSLKEGLISPSTSSSSSSSSSSSAVVYHHLRKQQAQKQWLGVLLALFVLIPVHVILTSRLGNNFQWIFPYNVAKWAAREIVAENNIGHVFQHRISPDLVLKLFPDVVLFYGYIYVNCGCALLVQAVPWLRRLSRQCHPSLLSLSTGELAFWWGFCVFLVVTFLYWYLVHGWEGNPIPAVSTAERFSRTVAQVALSMMGLMILPVSRNSVWSLVFSLSWEAMVRFHRVVSRGFLVASLIHMLSFWYAFSEKHVFPQAIFGAQPNGWIKDNETISVMSVLFLFFLLPVMGILTLGPVRRKYFELFYWSHFLSMVLFAATLWHAASAWYFLLPGLSLWAADHALRFTKACEVAECVSLKAVAPGVTEVAFVMSAASRAPLRFTAGQFVFLNIPEIASLEFHPFTVSASPLDAHSTCHIKAVESEAQFTSKLHQLARDYEGRLFLPAVHVDGPYGLPLDFSVYTSLLLVGGGIGITPLHSILRTIVLLQEAGQLGAACRLRSVRLVWAAKDPALLAVFRDTFSRVARAASLSDAASSRKPRLADISVEFFCRLGAGDAAAADEANSKEVNPIPTTAGRMDLDKEVEAMLRGGCGGDQPLVFVCGPASLVQEAARAATERDVEVHSETFFL